MLCVAMTNLEVRSASLKTRGGLFKKPSHRRQRKAQTLRVENTGPDGMAEPCNQSSQRSARAIDDLARKRKSKKARARAKARAKAQRAIAGTVRCDRGDYVAQIQLHS